MDSPVFAALAAGELLKIDGGEEKSKAIGYPKCGNYSESMRTGYRTNGGRAIGSR